MRLFVTIVMLGGVLLSCAPGSARDRVDFTPEQIDWLKQHGRYEQVLGADYDKQKRIQEIIQSELDLAGELKNLADSLQILYPEVTIEFEP